MLRPLLYWFSLTLLGALGAAVPAHAHGPAHEALARLDQQIEKAPADAQLYLQRGQLRGLHGPTVLALADFDRAAALAPGLAQVDLARARCLLVAGSPKEALAYLDRFFKRAPDTPEAYQARARALLALDRPLDAARAFERACASARHPSPDLYVAAARAYLAAPKAGRSAALAVLERGIRRLGPLIALHEVALGIERAAGDVAASLSRLDRMAAISGCEAPAFARRGEILAASGRRREARVAYQAALSALAHSRRTRAREALEAQAHSALRGLQTVTQPGSTHP